MSNRLTTPAELTALAERLEDHCKDELMKALDVAGRIWNPVEGMVASWSYVGGTMMAAKMIRELAASINEG